MRKSISMAVFALAVLAATAVGCVQTRVRLPAQGNVAAEARADAWTRAVAALKASGYEIGRVNEDAGFAETKPIEADCDGIASNKSIAALSGVKCRQEKTVTVRIDKTGNIQVDVVKSIAVAGTLTRESAPVEIMLEPTVIASEAEQAALLRAITGEAPLVAGASAEEKVSIPAQIVFSTASATIKPESETALGQLKDFLAQNQKVARLRIEGHTDNVGDPASNLRLSSQRALAVVEWLVGRGVAPGRLAPVGCGDTRAIADNAIDTGRAANRRTEFYALGAADPPATGACKLATELLGVAMPVTSECEKLVGPERSRAEDAGRLTEVEKKRADEAQRRSDDLQKQLDAERKKKGGPDPKLLEAERKKDDAKRVADAEKRRADDAKKLADAERASGEQLRKSLAAERARTADLTARLDAETKRSAAAASAASKGATATDGKKSAEADALVAVQSKRADDAELALATERGRAEELQRALDAMKAGAVGGATAGVESEKARADDAEKRAVAAEAKAVEAATAIEGLRAELASAKKSTEVKPAPAPAPTPAPAPAAVVVPASAPRKPASDDDDEDE